ncbi:MAG TPA: ABC transporter permease [Bacteroidia bacterium]|jgi:putative ABC transport system permease protein|nr:ABC transporter permease [Bacteroidia bacterium]
MFDQDNWQEIFATIKKNKLRTALTAFGVFWGIFMLVIMLGAGTGLKKGVMRDFEGSATNSFFMWTQKTTKPYQGMKPGRVFNFTNEDAIALRQLQNLDVIAPMNQLGGYEGNNNVTRGIKTGIFAVMAEYPQFREIQAVSIRDGRFINQNDIREKRKVCVIGKRASEILFDKKENPIGEWIRISGVYFMVVGITSPTGSGQQAEEQSQQIYVPFSTFQYAFNFGNRVGWFSVRSKNNVPASVAEEQALALLKERHKIAPEDLMAVGHWNMEKQFNKIGGLFVGINGLVWFVGIGTLIAGVIGVSNIMLIVVKERTREIGVKRALGATPFSVMAQLIMESVFLTSIAGYFGLLAGIGLLELISSLLPPDNNSMFSNPEVNLNVALTALSVLIVSGALAGMIPARRAVSIHPVEALRSE